jgi:hypothetical protein
LFQQFWLSKSRSQTIVCLVLSGVMQRLYKLRTI